MIIGFSTGANYKNFESASPEAVDLVRSVCCNAIEIMAGRKEEIDIIIGSLSEIREKVSAFQHVSLHAPCIEMSYGNDQASRIYAERIPNYY